MKKLIILAAVALMTGSCGIYGKYKPAKEAPEELYGDIAATGDTTSFGDLTWREVFTDPYLSELIDTALVRNSDIRTARLKVEEAQASLLTAKLSYLPSLALTPEGGITTFDGTVTKTYTAPVSASWEIDLFGRVTNAKRQAKVDAQLQIAESTEKAWEESVRTSRAMKKAGMLTEAGLAQTEATYYNICTNILDLKEQINQAENTMCLLLADTPHKIERGTLYEQQFPEEFSVGIPLLMLSNRPDVRQAEHALEQAFYATNAARSAFYPQITLSGSAGWSNNGGGIIINPGRFLASAIASLTQPLFNRGANIANLKIAKAQQEEASIAFEMALLTAGSEVNDALMQYQTAKGKAGYYEKQVSSLEIAAKSTALLMKHGNTTYLEVLTAQQTLLNARLNNIANRFSEIQSIITLYRALGGGRM